MEKTILIATLKWPGGITSERRGVGLRETRPGYWALPGSIFAYLARSPGAHK